MEIYRIVKRKKKDEEVNDLWFFEVKFSERVQRDWTYVLLL